MTAAGQTSTRPRLQAWRMTALRVALWILVAAGPVGAAAVWTQLESIDGQLQALADQASSTQLVDTSEVAGMAELAVADFLADAVTSEESMVVTTVSLGVEEVAVDYWAVTIAAARVGADVEDGLVHFYLVAVVDNGSGWAVAGPPALVAGPVAAERPDVAVAMTGIDDANVEQATEAFLAAYLTGDGDVTRYTPPGSRLTPVTPAPFVAVEVVDAGSTSHDEGRLVVVTVEATDPAGGVQALRYSIVLADRGGRWEVTELLPAPPLEGGSSDD